MTDRDDRVDDEAVEQALRWRLVLGRFAEEKVGFGALGAGVEGGGAGGGEGRGDLARLLGEGQSLDLQLECIYDREYQERSHRAKTGQGAGGGLSVPMWVREVRDLFPQEAVEVMERDALVRYGLTELVTDPEILRKAEPSEALLHAILQFKHQMKGEVLEVAREVVISDWYICVPEPPLLALAHELHEAGITCIGLSALDREAKAVYNEDHARKLAGVGWYVAALTPKQLAEHVGKIIAS